MGNVSKERETYRPRAIDRMMFAVLSAVLILNGVYLIGPWYISTDEAGKAPLYHMFNSDTGVTIYGVGITVCGLLLIFASAGRSASRYYTRITETALLGGFLLRLYSFIGVVLTLDSWRPPAYLSHLATVFMLGAYWVWVRVNVRPTE